MKSNVRMKFKIPFYFVYYQFPPYQKTFPPSPCSPLLLLHYEAGSAPCDPLLSRDEYKNHPLLTYRRQKEKQKDIQEIIKGQAIR